MLVYGMIHNPLSGLVFFAVLLLYLITTILLCVVFVIFISNL